MSVQALKDFVFIFNVYLLRRRVEAGQQSAWLAEYRRVFIMFVKLPAIHYEDPDVMELLQVRNMV